MKKTLFILLFAVLFSANAKAQLARYTVVDSAPTVCNEPFLTLDITTGTLYAWDGDRKSVV